MENNIDAKEKDSRDKDEKNQKPVKEIDASTDSLDDKSDVSGSDADSDQVTGKQFNGEDQ
ncbi:hypothetical protein [Pedobacter mucosus]|uniref:hypothetical protein n=1 Tax=Pedobacter mucosus TaxID=2895286 RepID=UPI001EE3A3F1|nr:hypothetical protein [Pedobacter mucosus]UKT62600.1 hypothetical protein LOK61_12605 [Pedobacter mucosus]